jgi:hypothetical protein
VNGTDPSTAVEWQEAVDLASGMLAVEAARLYGLITGGPKIIVARREEILSRGAHLGYTPRPEAIEEVATALARGG